MDAIFARRATIVSFLSPSMQHNPMSMSRSSVPIAAIAKLAAQKAIAVRAIEW
jgi:hypothetical protein